MRRRRRGASGTGEWVGAVPWQACMLGSRGPTSLQHCLPCGPRIPHPAPSPRQLQNRLADSFRCPLLPCLQLRAQLPVCGPRAAHGEPHYTVPCQAAVAMLGDLPCLPGCCPAAPAAAAHAAAAALPCPSFQPENANLEAVKARYENGVLVLDVPKREQKQEETKRITIG